MLNLVMFLGTQKSGPACYRETMQWKAAYERVSNEVAEVKAMILEMRESNQNASCASSVPVTSNHRPEVAIKPQSLQVCLSKTCSHVTFRYSD